MKGNGSLSSRAYDVQHWSPLVLAERRVTYNDTMVPVIGYDSLDVCVHDFHEDVLVLDILVPVQQRGENIGTGRVDILTHPYTTAACAAGVVTKTTDRDSLRYTYNGTRRVRQLALGRESS